MKMVDIDSVLSLAQATALKEAGIDGVLRYAPRQLDTYRYNLTNPEMLRILQAALALSVVQHVAPDGWEPTAELGTQYGNYMADYCTKTIQLPKGVTVWLDLEMVKSGTPLADTLGYVNEWYKAVNAAGYSCGLYVGYQPGADPHSLYEGVDMHLYWKGYNYDDGVATRGFCMVQHPQQTIAGLQVDPDTVQSDNLGGLPMFLSPS